MRTHERGVGARTRGGDAGRRVWNDEEYRREVKFVKKFKFLARLCRYVVFRESEHDAYEASVVDAAS